MPRSPLRNCQIISFAEHVGIGPENRLGIFERVGASGVGWIGLRVKGDVLRARVRPAGFVVRVPDGPIIQDLDFPDAVFAYVGVFVKAAFPPLARASDGTFVQPGLHDAAEARFGGGAIEQKSEDRTVFPVGEILAEAVAIEAAHTGLAAEDSGHEVHLAAFREKVDGLVVEALVNVIAVGVLQAPDGVDVLEHTDLILQFLDLLNQFVDRVFWHFSTPSYSMAGSPIGGCARFVSFRRGASQRLAAARTRAFTISLVSGTGSANPCYVGANNMSRGSKREYLAWMRRCET